MGRPRKHDDSTAEALVDAAEALLIEGGPAALSVRAVADRAGTSTRAVYALFQSKSGLVEAVAARGFRLLAQLVNGIPRTDDPKADLIAVGGAFREFATGHPTLFRLTFERVPAEVVVVRHVALEAVASYQALQDLIGRAQEAGVVDPDRSAHEIAFMIHATCQGLAGTELAAQPPPIGADMWSLLEGDDRSDEWDTVVTAVVEGLAPKT